MGRFSEALHPRDYRGRFARKGGGGSRKSSARRSAIKSYAKTTIGTNVGFAAGGAIGGPAGAFAGAALGYSLGSGAVRPGVALKGIRANRKKKKSAKRRK